MASAGSPSQSSCPGLAGELTKYAIFATLLLIPVATGIAILRYRLYDIDVVIRRTLVYGAVVAILGGLYVALVLGLQSLLSRIIGGDTLPVALSTLAIAVLVRTGPRARARRGRPALLPRPATTTRACWRHSGPGCGTRWSSTA